MLMVQVDGTMILLVRQDGLHALQGTCSHEYFELDKGFLTADSVTCALHLSRFDLTDGEPLDPPADLFWFLRRHENIVLRPIVVIDRNYRLHAASCHAVHRPYRRHRLWIIVLRQVHRQHR